jgi:hypothetical protein
MDCEGCEYNLVNEGKSTMQKFKRIQIEYHYGYEKLVRKLKECGFRVKFSSPEKHKNDNGDDLCIGFIYATYNN